MCLLKTLKNETKRNHWDAKKAAIGHEPAGSLEHWLKPNSSVDI